MLRQLVTAGLAIVALSTAPALAQTPAPAPAAAQAPAAPAAPLDPQAVGQCLIANSVPETEEAMRNFMLAALQRDREGVQRHAGAMGLLIVTTATQKCGVAPEQLAAPEFQRASEIYGAFLGQKVMADAMAGLN